MRERKSKRWEERYCRLCPSSLTGLDLHLGALVEIYRRKETQKRAVAVACRNSIVTSSSHKEKEDERIERKEKRKLGESWEASAELCVGYLFRPMKRFHRCTQSKETRFVSLSWELYFYTRTRKLGDILSACQFPPPLSAVCVVFFHDENLR
jgi:hypothetical protein